MPTGHGQAGNRQDSHSSSPSFSPSSSASPLTSCHCTFSDKQRRQEANPDHDAIHCEVEVNGRRNSDDHANEEASEVGSDESDDLDAKLSDLNEKLRTLEIERIELEQTRRKNLLFFLQYSIRSASNFLNIIGKRIRETVEAFEEHTKLTSKTHADIRIASTQLEERTTALAENLWDSVSRSFESTNRHPGIPFQDVIMPHIEFFREQCETGLLNHREKIQELLHSVARD